MIELQTEPIDLQNDESYQAVLKALKDLDDLEKNYKDVKATLTKDLSDSIAALGGQNTNKTKQAEAIRRLYWDEDLSFQTIARAFQISHAKVREQAGSFAHEQNCFNKCGRTMTLWFENRNERTQYLSQWTNYLYKKIPLRNMLCSACQEQSDEKHRDFVLKERNERLELNAQLAAMPWKKYIQTDSWINVRNQRLRETDFSCQICRREDHSLAVYPHKDTPQDAFKAGDQEFIESLELNALGIAPSQTHYEYFVLCGKCAPRVADRINREKKEVIGKEMLKLLYFNEVNY